MTHRYTNMMQLTPEHMVDTMSIVAVELDVENYGYINPNDFKAAVRIVLHGSAVVRIESYCKDFLNDLMKLLKSFIIPGLMHGNGDVPIGFDIDYSRRWVGGEQHWSFRGQPAPPAERNWYTGAACSPPSDTTT